MRLVACGLCRRLSHLVVDERLKAVLEYEERYADGQADKKLRAKIMAAGVAARSDYDCSTAVYNHTNLNQVRPAWEAADAVYLAAVTPGDRYKACVDASFRACDALSWVDYLTARNWGETEFAEEFAAQCDLVREIFGNPFEPVTMNPVWRTPAVVSLAQQMYEGAEFGEMVVLADALEEAGCRDQAILGHCRQTGGHVRGCWVVDLVLDKH